MQNFNDFFLFNGVPGNKADIRKFNYGPYAGMGCRLHIAGMPLLLKADARYGKFTIYEDTFTEMNLSYGRIVAVMEF